LDFLKICYFKFEVLHTQRTETAILRNTLLRHNKHTAPFEELQNFIRLDRAWTKIEVKNATIKTGCQKNEKKQQKINNNA